MNINFLQQIMKSANPQQMIMNMMNTQQKAMAHAWLDDVDACDNKVWWYFVK